MDNCVLRAMKDVKRVNRSYCDYYNGLFRGPEITIGGARANQSWVFVIVVLKSYVRRGKIDELQLPVGAYQILILKVNATRFNFKIGIWCFNQLKLQMLHCKPIIYKLF